MFKFLLIQGRPRRPERPLTEQSRRKRDVIQYWSCQNIVKCSVSTALNQNPGGRGHETYTVQFTPQSGLNNSNLRCAFTHSTICRQDNVKRGWCSNIRCRLNGCSRCGPRNLPIWLSSTKRNLKELLRLWLCMSEDETMEEENVHLQNPVASQLQPTPKVMRLKVPKSRKCNFNWSVWWYWGLSY